MLPRSMRALPLVLALLLTGCDRGAASSTTTPASAASALPVSSASVAAPPPSASVSSAVADAPPADSWLVKTLREGDPRWNDWLAQAEDLRLQILVTVVEPGDAPWKTHEFRADAEYFYPASAIKTLLAIAALKTLSAKVGGDIELGTRLFRCRDDKSGCEPPTEDERDDKDEDKDEDDAASKDGKKKHKKLRVGQEITKLLSYSDNDSYNRLWDIVGHRELNEMMAELGFGSVRFHHKMNAPAERSRGTLRVRISPNSKKGFEIPKRKSDFEPAPTQASRLPVGKSYRDKGKLFEEPLSFATKNYVSLHELQKVNISLLFTDRPEAARLGLSDAQRKHLIAAMTSQLKNMKHAAEHGPFTPGVVEVLKANRVRYVSKSGRAYGFHLENAYIEDTVTKRGFFVTATVYANPDGVMNDDDYAYEEISKPLLASLGAILTKALLTP